MASTPQYDVSVLCIYPFTQVDIDRMNFTSQLVIGTDSPTLNAHLLLV